jgi:NhaP-type Na+/H+ or K+/H+ antiporter
MLMFEWILVLLLAAVILTNLAERLAVPYPSLLAIAGVGLAFLPFAPQIRIEPELALALFVAPALLDAAFDTSPRDLRRNAIPIASLAVIAVVLTTAAVAFLGWRFAGLPIAAAIALGAIVAPPDAVAANEVMRHLRIPQRIGLVLRGESLLNDATALLIYRAAVAAAVGSFSLVGDAPILLLAAVGSLVAGYVLARLYMVATPYVRDAAGSTVLQFISTFGVWLLSERLTLSPIITVMVYAMTLAQAASGRLGPRLRITSYAVWETAVFVVNVLAFVLMGLQARPIIERLSPEQRWGSLVFGLTVLATCNRGSHCLPRGVPSDRRRHQVLASQPRGPAGLAGSARHNCHILERDARPRYAGNRIRAAPTVPRARPHHAMRVLRGARHARDPGPYAAAAAPFAAPSRRRRSRTGNFPRADRCHGGGTRQPRRRQVARGNDDARAIRGRSQGRRRPLRAAGCDQI